MIRSFTLTNSFGEKWELNNINSFFHKVKGLGQEHKATYRQIGTQFVKEKDLLSQKNITGIIRFADYSEYKNFSKFIQHKPLVLTYVSSETYNIKVSIDRLNKAELTTGGLFCDVAIKGLSTFYKNVMAVNKGMSSDGKKYPNQYPYTYEDSTLGTIEIESDSVLESPAKISIFGKCVNPSWVHYVNNQAVARGKVICNIEEGHKLVVDTTEIPYRISEFTTENVYVRDLYGYSDFETDRFIRLQYGKNRLTFMHESENPIKIVVEGMIEYESV